MVDPEIFIFCHKSILWKIRSHTETPCAQVSSRSISPFKRFRRKIGSREAETDSSQVWMIFLIGKWSHPKCGWNAGMGFRITCSGGGGENLPPPCHLSSFERWNHNQISWEMGWSKKSYHWNFAVPRSISSMSNTFKFHFPKFCGKVNTSGF